MQIEARHEGHVTIIHADGSVDANSAQEFEGYLLDTIRAGRNHVVVDLSGVDYMSSAALRALLAGLKAARQSEGDLLLAAPQQGVRKIIDMAGVSSLCKTFDDLDDALAHL